MGTIYRLVYRLEGNPLSAVLEVVSCAECQGTRTSVDTECSFAQAFCNEALNYASRISLQHEFYEQAGFIGSPRPELNVIMSTRDGDRAHPFRTKIDIRFRNRVQMQQLKR